MQNLTSRYKNGISQNFSGPDLNPGQMGTQSELPIPQLTLSGNIILLYLAVIASILLPAATTFFICHLCNRNSRLRNNEDIAFQSVQIESNLNDTEIVPDNEEAPVYRSTTSLISLR
jgi:hypothetical protein